MNTKSNLYLQFLRLLIMTQTRQIFWNLPSRNAKCDRCPNEPPVATQRHHCQSCSQDGCLQIMLESAQVPNQQALVAFIRKGITSLEVASIQEMKVYGGI
jgi:hypothetical protein